MQIFYFCRFEAEIAGRQVIGASTFNHVQQKLHDYGSFNLPGFGNIPAPPAQLSMVPQQVKGPKRGGEIFLKPAVVSAKPTLYKPKKVTQMQAPPLPPHPPPLATPVLPTAAELVAIQTEVEKKLRKLKEKVTVPAELAISQGM